MPEKELKTKEDFLALKSGDVLRVGAADPKNNWKHLITPKTEVVCLNELCYRINDVDQYKKKDYHAENDMLIVDSLDMFYVKEAGGYGSSYFAMKITSKSDKFRTPKATIITLVDSNMKKHLYKIDRFVDCGVSFYKQEE